MISFLIYFLGRKAYSHVITDKNTAATGSKQAETGSELSPEQTRQRVVALFLVFAVVIFFWMVFHQNGATLTEFAKSCTAPEATGWTRVGFNLLGLTMIAAAVWCIFRNVQGQRHPPYHLRNSVRSTRSRVAFYIYPTTPDVISGIQPQQYQQFNPFYVVALTP